MDNPIGERHNSPIVITPYVPTSHNGDTFTAPFPPTYTAATITKQESAEINNPKTIFEGVDGSFPFLRIKTKEPTTKGVSNIIQPGFMD